MNDANNVVFREDRLQALRLVPVSRETAERLDIFVDRLRHWRQRTNLISQATFANLWIRHIADSAQILLTHPRAIRWLDIGSGAGFPGMVLAMQLADVDGAVVHCVESDQRKCAFLREVVRATRAPAIVHPARIGSINPSISGIVEGITARAFAPLSTTLDMAKAWLLAGAVGVFPRGRSIAKQFDALSAHSHYETNFVPSIIDAAALIVRVIIRLDNANEPCP